MKNLTVITIITLMLVFVLPMAKAQEQSPTNNHTTPQNGNNIDITVQKVGNIPTAIALTIMFQDGTTQSVNKSATEWKDGKDSVTISVSVDKKVKEVKLGSPDIPDANQDNNSFTLK